MDDEKSNTDLGTAEKDKIDRFETKPFSGQARVIMYQAAVRNLNENTDPDKVRELEEAKDSLKIQMILNVNIYKQVSNSNGDFEVKKILEKVNGIRHAGHIDSALQLDIMGKVSSLGTRSMKRGTLTLEQLDNVFINFTKKDYLSFMLQFFKDEA